MVLRGRRCEQKNDNDGCGCAVIVQDTDGPNESVALMAGSQHKVEQHCTQCTHPGKQSAQKALADADEGDVKITTLPETNKQSKVRSIRLSKLNKQVCCYISEGDCDFTT